MRALVVVLVMALAGCGSVRYTGTEADMQKVARGAAEAMKKDPNTDKVSGAATVAHAALTMAMGGTEPATEEKCVSSLSGGCLRPWQVNPDQPAPPSAKSTVDAYTGLPKDFYKTTSIGKED